MTKNVRGRKARNEIEVSGQKDRGAATILGVAIIVVCLIGGLIGVGLGELAAARAHIASAADLAALAGASHVLDGTDGACKAAIGTAQRNGAALTSCTVEGSDVVVALRIPAPRIVRAVARMAHAQAPALRAGARAGPPVCDGLLKGDGMCQSGPTRSD